MKLREKKKLYYLTNQFGVIFMETTLEIHNEMAKQKGINRKEYQNDKILIRLNVRAGNISSLKHLISTKSEASI